MTPAHGWSRAGRCQVVGVVNVTPDSFSDGGRFLAPPAAVEHGLRLHRQGADLIDVGGESTRPGADRVAAREELRRVLPVVAALAEAGVPVSIDTTRAAVARRAVDAGAVLVNDVSGGVADPEMLPTIAALGVRCVLMHSRGLSATMQSLARYGDVVAEVLDELTGQVEAAVWAGVDRDRIIIDPGLGFAKRPEHNWQLLRALSALVGTGYAVLFGASRKRFLGDLLRSGERLRPPAELDAATTAATALAAFHGVWGVRVHDVRAAADAVAVSRRWAGPEARDTG
jgi:dihydropteroate synthase